MPSRRVAWLCLLALPPVLTEVTSGSTPVLRFLDPPVALFLVLAYSIPLVVIRELRARWRLRTGALALLGLAYGVLNEGLLAQTLIRPEHVPIGSFDRYLVVGGFVLSWAAVILPWHAFFAVVFPLALLDRWFPPLAGQAWLGRRAFGALTAVVVLLVLLLSMGRTPHPQMLACLGVMAVLVAGAWLAGRRRGPSAPVWPGRHPLLAGLLGYPVLLLPLIALAGARVQPAAYVAVVAVMVAVLAGAYRRRGRPCPSARLALGSYGSLAGFLALLGFAGGNPQAALTGTALLAGYLALARSDRRRGGLTKQVR